MMKKLTGLAIIALLSVAAGAQTTTPQPSSSRSARDLEILGYGLDIHGTFEAAFQSQFIWRGFDLYRDKGALQGLADVKIADTGFGASVTAHRAVGSGNELWQRWDYKLYYQNSLCKGEPIEAQYQLAYGYYNYPKWTWRAWDLQEGQATVSLPNITMVKGLVPSVQVVKLWPSGSDSMAGGNASGWLYLGMLDYVFSVPGFVATMPEQVIKLHGEIEFNDGFSPFGTTVDSDWSDAIIGVSTDFDLGYGIAVTPSVYYEQIMDSSISPDNADSEVWFTVSAKLMF
jgi:hypothetical protein